MSGSAAGVIAAGTTTETSELPDQADQSRRYRDTRPERERRQPHELAPDAEASLVDARQSRAHDKREDDGDRHDLHFEVEHVAVIFFDRLQRELKQPGHDQR